MTGTGTELDPYVVDNISDCLTAISESGAYVCLGENKYMLRMILFTGRA